MAKVTNETHRRDLVTRLKRIEGQLRGIQAMIEAAEDCEKIVQQVSASRRALDKVFFNVLACAVQSDGKVRTAAELLAKFG
jgi:DNA-binding FrmR family transcriptional regulator